MEYSKRKAGCRILLIFLYLNFIPPDTGNAHSLHSSRLSAGEWSDQSADWWTLIDGFGGKPLANSIILIEGERIKAIGQVGQLAIPPDAEIISTEGMSIMPGLWDMHVHLMINGHSDCTHWDKTYLSIARDVIMPASAHQLLMAGVTSARDLGGPLEPSISVRDRINKGEIPGPTMYMSGPFIQHEPYPGTASFRWGVKGAAEARAKVQQLARAGVNCIKLIDQDQMTMEEVSAVVDEAHKTN